MTLITTEEAMTYLRVDSSDEDYLIDQLTESAQKLALDAARLTEADLDDEEKNVTADIRIATFYALGYLYEHREEANHHQLTLDLRSLLFGSREARF